MAAVSPTSIDDATLRFTVSVNGSAIKDTYPVVSIYINHELNKISTAEITILDGDITTSDFPISNATDLIPDNPITITAGYGDNAEENIFTGIIVKQSLEISERGNLLIVTCKHAAVKMTFNRTEAMFANKTDSAILTSILGNYGISASIQSSSVSQTAMYQKMATDWDFLLSRAEFLGYVIAMDSDTLNVKPPVVSGSASLLISWGDAIRTFRAELSAERQPPGLTVNAWDITSLAVGTKTAAEPSVNAQGNLSPKTLSGKLAQTNLTLNSGTYMTTDELALWADSTLLKKRLSAMKGEVTFIGSALAKTGGLIELAGVGERYNGDAYVSAVSHSIRRGSWETTVRFGLDDRPVSERIPVSYAPAFGLLPAVHGLQIAKVAKLSGDPDSQSRVQVTIASPSETPVSIWARIVSFYATNASGAVFMPEIGDEVIIGYLESDPRYPIILGSVYSSSNASPSPASDENNYIKTLVTKSKIKLTFDDENKVLTIETPGANKITFSDQAKSVEIVDQNSNSIKMTSSGINIESAKDITLKATGNITLDATGKASITAQQDAAITGMNVTNTAQMGFTAKGNATAELSASGQTTVKGAIVMIN